MKNSVINVTIVIPVKNEENAILPLLKSLEKLSVYPSEVIIVDGGSKDKTIFLVNQYIQQVSLVPYSIKLIEAGQALPGKGRNIGIKNAKNDIVVCTDADVEVEPEWLQKLLKPFGESNVDIVVGELRPLATTFFEVCSFYLGIKGLRKKDIIFSGCASVAFKKDVWRKVGGFEEGLYPCEDKFFFYKANKAGFSIKKTYEAVAYWRSRPNIIQFARQCFLYALADGEINFIKRHHLLRILFYMCNLSFLILGITWKIFFSFFIVIHLFYLLYNSVLGYKRIENPLVFLYIPWMTITKDVSQIWGYIIGNIKRLTNPYLKKLAGEMVILREKIPYL